MTQPPGQQQPQGGFGVSPGTGQGFPQPPAQPPQIPPKQPPYSQPGPYGQQPGPYGQQPGPYGQQSGPYGGYQPQPPTQYPGVPTPPGGGGGLFKGKPGVVIGAAVAGLLVIGGGTWFVLSGDGKDDKPGVSRSSDSPKPSGPASADEGSGTAGGEGDLNAGRRPGEANILFLKQNDIDVPGNGAEIFGPWVEGDTIVKAMSREVAGFSVTDGRKKWSVKLGADACLAAPQVSAGGKIVIGVKSGLTAKADCSELQMIDAKTGKAGWKTSVPKPKDLTGFSDFILAIGGNTVTAAGLDTSYGFSLNDGKQLFGKPSSGCLPYGFAGGTRLIAAANCPTSAAENVKQEIQNVDPATGRATWTYALPADWEVDKVYSVSPPVVSIKLQADDSDENTQRRVIALTDSGKLRSQLQLGKDKFKPRCSSSLLAFRGDIQGWCTGVAADASTLYLSTEPTGTNDVVAFSLDTGKPKWRSPAGGDRTMTPLTVQDGSVVVYIAPTYSVAGAVATIAPAGGAPKVVLKHQLAAVETESGFMESRTVYADGRFFLTATRINGLNDAEERETKTMMAFGK
ncbi:PQQ-binding-like beta-propeller repeat protein [Streptomyces lunaelactis]|uniref:outer membrane protein assembly factor BamB family protein n=3 Tax=Streptomyces lunaelactis TaxID=1535768 RepID=UPI00158457B1|nr:PQQ-binding-like beta-propeller repeat protein [Streptomyces lunaelactis]NUK44647.1 PQQ-binding-like beta-propeller repeat protein [Streptomyces lunaelactis]NUL34286.1 PQQ-binding-like beta-propeller repeat protein [Streptomyces lunaelactis]